MYVARSRDIVGASSKNLEFVSSRISLSFAQGSAQAGYIRRSKAIARSIERMNVGLCCCNKRALSFWRHGGGFLPGIIAINSYVK